MKSYLAYTLKVHNLYAMRQLDQSIATARTAAMLAEKIFDRFYKVDAFVPGVGLGLPIARLYAQRIGATVWLDTSSPSPTCFVVSLPPSSCHDISHS